MRPRKKSLTKQTCKKEEVFVGPKRKETVSTRLLSDDEELLNPYGSDGERREDMESSKKTVLHRDVGSSLVTLLSLDYDLHFYHLLPTFTSDKDVYLIFTSRV